MASPLREILASFGIEVDSKELSHGHSLVEGFIGKLKKFGEVAAEAFAVYELKEFVSGLAEQAEQLEIQARTLGISTDALQKWQFAANLSGVSAETLQVGLQKLQRSAVGASKGGGDLGAVFSKLHIDVKEAGGGFKNADQLLEDVAGAIGDLKDPTEQTAIAMQIFGRGGAALLPFLKQGRAGVAALKDEVEKLGGGFDETFIQKSTQLIQDQKRLDFAMKGLKVSLAGPLVPLLTSLVQWSTKAVVEFGHWVKGTKAIQAALAVFGTVGLLKTVTGVVKLASKLGLLKKGFSGLLLELLPLVAAFLILEDVWVFLSGGKSVTGKLLDKFFGPDAAAKVQAFASALKNDIGPVLSEVFAIFTDGKPLDEKLKELQTYIDSTLKPQFKTDFGEMADTMLKIVAAAGDVAKAIDVIARALKEAQTSAEWLMHLKGIGALDAPLANAAADDNARNDAVARRNPGAAPSAADFALNRKPLFQRALAFVVGFKEEDAVPKDLRGGSSNVASAPLPTQQNQSSAPIIHNETTINQRIEASVPADVRKAAQDGAKAGATEGNNLRTMRALVPSPG